MLNFTLKQLEIFLAIAETSSFSRAAETLYLNQSTVSAHLKQLEKELGKPLFSRACRRQISLTPEGKALYPLAKQVLTTCDQIPPLFQTAQTEAPILLGASTVPGQYLLPGYLSAFLSQNKDFRYVLRRGDSADIHALLQAGEIRIGFVGTISAPETVDYHPLAEDKLIMVTPNTPRYQTFKAHALYGRDLLEEPMVAREEGSGTDRSARHYIRSIGFPAQKLNIIARVDDPEAIKHMVATGAGVSILSSLSVEQEIRDGTLLSFEMDHSALKRHIYMITPRNFTPSPQEERFITFLKRFCSKT